MGADGDQWLGDPEEFVRIHPEELQNTFVSLLHRVGAIADTKMPTALVFDYCRAHPVTLPDEADDFLSAMPALPRSVGYIERELMYHFTDGTPLPGTLASLPGLDALVRSYAVRDIMEDCLPVDARWNGIAKLSDLFESGEAPKDPGTYFDQRFIDYLNAQPGELDQMHWRQFERLTGEFFHRIGHRATLGPGRDDGGKDVLAIKEGEVVSGPCTS